MSEVARAEENTEDRPNLTTSKNPKNYLLKVKLLGAGTRFFFKAKLIKTYFLPSKNRLLLFLFVRNSRGILANRFPDTKVVVSPCFSSSLKNNLRVLSLEFRLIFWSHSALALTGVKSIGSELVIRSAAQTGIYGNVSLLMNTIFFEVISTAVKVNSHLRGHAS